MAGLEQQVKLQAGEIETTDAERPADAVPNNPMVFLTYQKNKIQIVKCIQFKILIKITKILFRNCRCSCMMLMSLVVVGHTGIY